MSRFCLALCLALTFACNASAVQQRLHILQALQGVPATHVPQMLMTHDRPGAHELPGLDTVLLPALMALLQAPASDLPEIEFKPSLCPATPIRRHAQLRGPPLGLLRP